MLLAKEIKYFIFIGILTVIIDYLSYLCMIFFELNISIAKTIGFVLGATFSFFSNRIITFRKNEKNHWQHLIRFILLNMVTLFINVYINYIILLSLNNNFLKIQLSFVFATAVSAILNFIGMKWLVFK
jgi:putative flippase GtrA